MTKTAQLRNIGKGLELANLIGAYLLASQAEGKSSRTITWYEQKLGTFIDHLHSRRLPRSA